MAESVKVREGGVQKYRVEIYSDCLRRRQPFYLPLTQSGAFFPDRAGAWATPYGNRKYSKRKWRTRLPFGCSKNIYLNSDTLCSVFHYPKRQAYPDFVWSFASPTIRNSSPCPSRSISAAIATTHMSLSARLLALNTTRLPFFPKALTRLNRAR
jgi:hypothetical protein